MPGPRSATFGPDTSSASTVRRFAAGALDEWDRSRFCDDAVLCATELSTNAILHARSPFTVTVRPLRSGVRIDVLDDRPDRLPVTLPPRLDPLAGATTGRGLRIVACLSSRWGYFTTDSAKTVWLELSDQHTQQPENPIVELAERAEPPRGPIALLEGIPVRAAVASGTQIDDLVRELQLDPGRLAAPDRELFSKLLECSAAVRLLGRQEALRAAAAGLDRFSVEVAVSEEELRCLDELAAFLGRLSAEGKLTASRPAPEVVAMRDWLQVEVAAQLGGRPPRPFPGR